MQVAAHQLLQAEQLQISFWPWPSDNSKRERNLHDEAVLAPQVSAKHLNNTAMVAGVQHSHLRQKGLQGMIGIRWNVSHGECASVRPSMLTRMCLP